MRQQCNLISDKELEQNQARLAALCNGAKNVLVKAEWQDEEPISQIEAYADREKEMASQVRSYNRMVEAVREGLDNIPYVRLDCGRVAYLMALAYGCTVQVTDHAVSAKAMASTIQQVKQIGKPELIEQRGLYPEIFARMQEFERRMGPVAFVPADTQSPFDVLTEIIQMEPALMMMYDAPDVLLELLQKITDSIVKVTRVQKNLVTNWVYGNDYPLSRGIHLSDDDAAFLSPELYREFCQPFVEQLSRKFGGVTLHCCMRYAQNVGIMAQTHGIMGMDPQPRFHSFEELFPHLRHVPFWRIFWLPDTDAPLEYYKKLIDATQDICGLMLEISGERKEEVLKLAYDVKNYAVGKNRC